MRVSATDFRGLGEEFARALVACGAKEVDAYAYVEHKGLGGLPGKSLAKLTTGRSKTAAYNLVSRIEDGPLLRVIDGESDRAIALIGRVQAALPHLRDAAPGTDEDLRDDLRKQLVPIDLHPVSLVRMADILGIPHEMRVVMWKGRPKFADSHCTRPTDVKCKKVHSLEAVVLRQMADVHEMFTYIGRRLNRAQGAVGASQLADIFNAQQQASEFAVSAAEAKAMLRPFAFHVGRHDGDDWFAFFNSPNIFAEKALHQVRLRQACSFAALCDYVTKSSRSEYKADAEYVPADALKEMLRLYDLVVHDDNIVSANGDAPQAEEQGLARQLVSIFKTLQAARPSIKGVRRDALRKAAEAAGMAESSVRWLLPIKSKRGPAPFTCDKNMVYLVEPLDEARVREAQVAAQAANAVSLADADDIDLFATEGPAEL